ncbi:hypothetical protein PVAG01_05658 [Phlyctema vagabunda]|uniref:DUF7708 domain-containing protein n=1 Tax=Phlyctema vagabunda TaxID=108571 RepID=A0ABR4PKR3_9HELO
MQAMSRALAPEYLTAPQPWMLQSNSLSLVPQGDSNSSNINSVAGWYTGDARSNGLEPARQAYQDSLREFRKHLLPDDKTTTTVWLQDDAATTITDVHEAVIIAKHRYEVKSPRSRARKWLASCSSRLKYYAVIMDTLAQHHPEYVSLAWGAFKFLFTAVINHEELLTEISKTVAKIGDILPRTDLCANLYPTQRMREAVAQLYAKIMGFVQEAVKWYKKGKVSHAVTAIFKPYDLGFKGIVEDISEASRRIDQEASAASKAEIRDLNNRLQHFMQLSVAHFNRQSLATFNISDQITNQGGSSRYHQLAQIRSLPALAGLERNARESIDVHRSIKHRRRIQLLVEPEGVLKLREWHQDRDAFPLLLANCTGLHTTPRDFCTELVDLLRDSKILVIWIIDHIDQDEDMVSSTNDLLLSLSLQALLLNPKALDQGYNSASIHHFAHLANEEQHFELLGRCLSGVPRMYIVMEVAVIRAAVGYQDSKADSFMKRFLDFLTRLPGREVKLVLAAEDFEANFRIYEEDHADQSRIWIKGQAPEPSRKKFLNRRLRHSSHVFDLGSSSVASIDLTSKESEVTNWN